MYKLFKNLAQDSFKSIVLTHWGCFKFFN